MPTARRGEASAFDFGAGGADTLRDFGWALAVPAPVLGETYASPAIGQVSKSRGQRRLAMSTDSPTIAWIEDDQPRSAPWYSEAGVAAPQRVVLADDTLTADAAYRLACEGTALLWRGDFQNARQLLQAIARRIDRKPRKIAPSPTDAFNQQRMAQAQRARTLGRLLIAVDADYRIALRRAPDVVAACREAYGDEAGPRVVALRELQGVIGAHEWRKKGVAIAALGASIHPHYGVFSPVRGEYVDLVAQQPLPAAVAKDSVAFDIGTGTGVLAIAAARALRLRVLASDIDPIAIATARNNIRFNKAGAYVESFVARGTTARAMQTNKPFDLVFANILMGPLVRLAAPMSRLLAPGATVILSGLLHSHANAALAAYRAQGLHLIHQIKIDEWTTLVLSYGGGKPKKL